MQFSHQGASFTGLTGMGGAGASQALVSGWVSEEQLQTVLPLCLSMLEGSWLGRVGSVLSFLQACASQDIFVSCSSPAAFVL